MNNFPVISVIIPCYNVREYVGKCIDSLSAQTIKNLEFIFINDGSSDGTLELLLDFKSRDERVVLLDKKNEGVSKARNDGLRLARGKYIFFLDGDDYLDSDACEKLYDFAEKDNVDILLFDFCFIRSKGVVPDRLNIPIGVYTLPDFMSTITRLPISPKLYKRSIIIDNEVFFDEGIRVGEVFCFFVHYLLYCDKIKVCDAFLYNYVEREGSATQDILNAARDFDIVDTVQKIEYYAGKCRFPLLDAPAFKRSLFSLIGNFSLFKYAQSGYFSSEIRENMMKIFEQPDIKKYWEYFAYKTHNFFPEKIFSFLALRSITACYCASFFFFKARRSIMRLGVLIKTTPK